MQLTSAASVLLPIDRPRILNDFAYSFGWTPSDSLDIPSTRNFANAHLIVEHGLENQAVITFLQRPYKDINYEEKRQLLGISYNNLVDWHIQIEPDQILYVFNRFDLGRIVENRNVESDLLRYFIAVLNSSICYRYISEHSHKYGSGYSMLEPRTLLKTPVPDPTKIATSEMYNLLLLVDKRLLASGREAIKLEIEINRFVANLYGLSDSELASYGVSI
jgi:hypothetical protein